MLSSDFFLVSAVIAVYCGTRRSSCQLERCFHCWLNWTNSFPSISQPPNRQPIPTVVLLCPSTWDFLPWNTPDSETWTFYRISPWPTTSASQVTRAFTLHLYSPGLLLLLYFSIADTFWLFWLLCTRNLGLSLGQNIYILLEFLHGPSWLSYIAPALCSHGLLFSYIHFTYNVFWLFISWSLFITKL